MIVRFLLCAALLISAGCAASVKEEPAPRPVRPGVSPERIIEEAARPGSHHALLDPFVGRWNATVRFWVDPARPPHESRGTSINSWIFDGRFLRQEYSGEIEGRPFRGLGIWGFDNAAREYTAMWIDSMTTAIMLTAGSVDPTGREFTMSGTVTDPLTGGVKKLRTVTRLLNSNRYTFEIFEARGAQEARTLEVVYSR